MPGSVTFPPIPRNPPIGKTDTQITRRVKPVEHSRIQVSGRIRKIPTDVITIHVYANGKVLEPARRVTLTHAMLRNWVTVLAQITDKVNLTSGATRRLYTLEGVQVNEAKDLQTTHFYVAVGADIGGFKKMEYGSQRPAFNISPKRERRKLDPIVMPASRKRGSRKTTQNGSLDSSMNGSSSKSTPASDKSLRQPHRVRPIEKRPPARREEDGPFHAKPVKHKRIPEPERQPEVDYDKDEGGVFKAKDHSRETDGARPVDDTDDTKVDLPIDQVEAEEVQDDQDCSDDVELPSDTDGSLTKRPSDANKTDNTNMACPALTSLSNSRLLSLSQ